MRWRTIISALKPNLLKTILMIIFSVLGLIILYSDDFIDNVFLEFVQIVLFIFLFLPNLLINLLLENPVLVDFSENVVLFIAMPYWYLIASIIATILNKILRGESNAKMYLVSFMVILLILAIIVYGYTTGKVLLA